MTGQEENDLLVMSKPFLEDFVAFYAKEKEIYLSAVRQFGSPLYVLEPDVLIQRAGQFKKAFEKRLEKVKCFFAMKSNNLPFISKILSENKFGIDVSSGLELQTALSVGADSIIFSGPGKTDAELAMALDNASKVTLLLDSAGEFFRLKSLLRTGNPVVEIGIRLNSNPKGLWRKFGVTPDQLPQIYQEVKASKKVAVKGLQFHSSWNLDPDRQIAFIKILGSCLEKMPDDFIRSLDFIDIGGGYWPPQGEWLVSPKALEHHRIPAQGIESFAEQLARALKKHVLKLKEFAIHLEPGRWICNDAMHLLIGVVDKKAHDLVITDAGTNAVGWERFETDYFPVINLSRFENIERPCHILGSLCTPHDVWGYAYFGESINQGDILMIPTQGAYTYSLRQHFIKPLPETVVLDRRNTPPAALLAVV